MNSTLYPRQGLLFYDKTNFNTKHLIQAFDRYPTINFF